mgnify:CR=1 FL=1
MRKNIIMPKLACSQPRELFENAIKISCKLVNGTPFFYEAESGRAIGGITHEWLEVAHNGALLGKIEFYVEADDKCHAPKD